MTPYERGEQDCVIDDFENALFASIGGLPGREVMVAPAYVPEAERAEYIQGYSRMALVIYGDDWQTCDFAWHPAYEVKAP